MKFWPLLLNCSLALTLAGCATPAALRDAPANVVSVETARNAPEAHEGEPVVWGGEIVAVRNGDADTELEILARPLEVGREPAKRGDAGGRFIARHPDFLDPAEYAVGRRVTVIGPFEGVREGRIGDYLYRYPVVAVERIYLWPDYEPYGPYLGPDPFWDPFFYRDDHYLFDRWGYPYRRY